MHVTAVNRHGCNYIYSCPSDLHGLLRVNLELHRPVGGGRGAAGAEVERRIWARGLKRRRVWSAGRVCPLPIGDGSGEGAVIIPAL